jgi:hypothetical protein
MKQNISWKTNSSSASHKITRIFLDLNVHYCLHNDQIYHKLDTSSSGLPILCIIKIIIIIIIIVLVKTTKRTE